MVNAQIHPHTVVGFIPCAQNPVAQKSGIKPTALQVRHALRASLREEIITRNLEEPISIVFYRLWELIVEINCVIQQSVIGQLWLGCWRTPGVADVCIFLWRQFTK